MTPLLLEREEPALGLPLGCQRPDLRLLVSRSSFLRGLTRWRHRLEYVALKLVGVYDALFSVVNLISFRT